MIDVKTWKSSLLVDIKCFRYPFLNFFFCSCGSKACLNRTVTKRQFEPGATENVDFNCIWSFPISCTACVSLFGTCSFVHFVNQQQSVVAVHAFWSICLSWRTTPKSACTIQKWFCLFHFIYQQFFFFFFKTITFFSFTTFWLEVVFARSIHASVLLNACDWDPHVSSLRDDWLNVLNYYCF